MRFLQSGMLGIESNRSSSALKFIFGFLIWEQGLKTARYMQNYIVSPTCGPLITIVSALCLYCQVKLIMVKKSFYKRKSPLWASLPPVGDYRKNYNFLVSIVFNSLIIKVGSTCIFLKYIQRYSFIFVYIFISEDRQVILPTTNPSITQCTQNLNLNQNLVTFISIVSVVISI